jgi:hypothetical protein
MDDMSPSDIRAVRRGHFANCSATGSVIGLALLSMTAVGAITSAFADRFARWAGRDGGPGGPGEAPQPLSFSAIRRRMRRWWRPVGRRGWRCRGANRPKPLGEHPPMS